MRRALMLLALLVIFVPGQAQAFSFTFDWIITHVDYGDTATDIGIEEDDRLTVTITYQLDNLDDPYRVRNVFWPTHIKDASGILASLIDGYAEGDGSVGPSDAGADIQSFHFGQDYAPLSYLLRGEVYGLGTAQVGQVIWTADMWMIYQTRDEYAYLSGYVEHFRDRLPVAGQTPEPATFALLGTALGAVWLRTRRRGSGGPA